MRYLGQFPSEAQVRDAIIPEVSYAPNSDRRRWAHGDGQIHKVRALHAERFEFQLHLVLKDRDFEPDDPEALLAAFKMLDPEGKGYIEIEEMRRHLETEGYCLSSIQNWVQYQGDSGFHWIRNQ